MKRLISCIVSLILCIGLLAVPVMAVSASASLSGPGTVRAGDTITLTFNLSGSGIFGASGTLSYDSSQLELKGTSQKIGSGWVVEFNGNNFVAYDNNLAKPINSKTALFTVTFAVKGNVAPGTVIKVSYTGVTASDGNADANLGTVSYSATIAAPLSGDNALKSLTVSNAEISPAFSAGTTSYTASVPYEVSKLDVKAEANHEKAKVSIDSPTLTPNGTTKVTVTVTAENGSGKTYTISVKRAQDPNYVPSDNNNLSEITVEGFLLSPVFSPENTRYVIWLPYEVDSVTIGAKEDDGRASVRVEGGSNLIAGADNEIKVICKAENGEEKVYTVIAKRGPAHDGSTEPTEPSTEPPTEPPTVPPTEPTTQPTEATTQPTEPATTPTQPQEPAADEAEGASWGIVAIVGAVCFAGGIAAGVVVGKKKK